MKKPGRPAHVKTEENAQRVEQLCAYGMDHVTIAKIFGISHDTLTKYYRDELDVGKAKVVEQVANSLKQNALNGDTQAQKFFLSSRAGWSESSQQKVDASVTLAVVTGVPHASEAD
jgi:hypothetical protein